MPRTLVDLDDENKAWLDRQAALRGVPMTELVRQAVRDFRIREDRVSKPAFRDTLKRTAGIWRAGDGLAFQERLRREW